MLKAFKSSTKPRVGLKQNRAPKIQKIDPPGLDSETWETTAQGALRQAAGRPSGMGWEITIL